LGRNSSLRKIGRPLKLDIKDYNIIEELLNNPDISSASIARKYKTPLSTIQRRRDLEKSILEKRYIVRTDKIGLRSGYLFVSVEKGFVNKIGELLIQKSFVYSVIAGLNDHVNLIAHIWYRSSQELLEARELVKALPNVSSVNWFEEVHSFGYNNSLFLAALAVVHRPVRYNSPT
jgi:DNA-binding Lrp family transcriptional regulator